MRLERDHRILGGPRLGHPHILGADGPVQHPRAAPDMSAACWHTETTPTGDPSTASMTFAENCAAVGAAGAAGIGDPCSRSRAGTGMGVGNWRCSFDWAAGRFARPTTAWWG